MKSEAQHNALNAIAKRCNSEMKAVNKLDLSALRCITNRHSVDAKLLGFTHTDMMVEIGRVNGVLKNRRLD